MPQIISRKEAKALGLKRYFTGKPCKHGHLSERSIDNGCLECVRLKSKRRYTPKPKTKSPRQIAIENGETTYFTGKPCKHGHVCPRWTSNCICVECHKPRAVSFHNRWRPANRHKIAGYNLTWKANNPDYDSQRYKLNPASFKQRATQRKRLLKEQYESLSDVNKRKIDLLYEQMSRLNSQHGPGSFHVDHVIPLSKGGKHHPDNLRIITAKENLAKGAKLPQEIAA